jgi:hypothetical protein
MIKLKTIFRYSLAFGLLFLALGLFSVPTFAQTVTQGYSSDVLLQRGMIVGLVKDDPRKVEPINNEQFDRVHGVVIGSGDSAVLLGRDDEKVFVASGGRFTTLVSNQNGDIAVGDFVAISSVSGVGMKAGEVEPVIIGKAIEAFDSNNEEQIRGTAIIKDNSGTERAIKLGLVTVDISIGRNPLLKNDNTLPDALKKASELIAGKPVGATRVYLSLAILISSSAISASLIYGAVRSSLIAIGRNPLSKKSIIKGMFQVVLIGIMVFISGIFGVYLLLKL